MPTFLSQLNWRFATKRFDVAKSVTEENFNKILEAIRLAPSSLGLQPFHVYVVKDAEFKQRLYLASKNQAQVLEAPYLLIFCARLDVNQMIEDYIEAASNGDSAIRASLEPLKQARLQSLQSRPAADLLSWAGHSAYIALGFGLAACAELGIDSCPMEGFDRSKVDEILNLPPHQKSLAYLAVGYRSHEPTKPKARLAKNDLFSFI
jgi:nitroreductase